MVVGYVLLLVDDTVVVPECAVGIPECVIVVPIAGEMHLQLFHYGDVLQQRELCVVHVVVDALVIGDQKVGDDRSAVAQRNLYLFRILEGRLRCGLVPRQTILWISRFSTSKLLFTSTSVSSNNASILKCPCPFRYYPSFLISCRRRIIGHLTRPFTLPEVQSFNTIPHPQIPTWLSHLVPTFSASWRPALDTQSASQCAHTQQSQESHRSPILLIFPR